MKMQLQFSGAKTKTRFEILIRINDGYQPEADYTAIMAEPTFSSTSTLQTPSGNANETYSFLV